jgi:hypothetical protein
MMSSWQICLLLVFFVSLGCQDGSKSQSKPTGTPTDPVEVCEKHAQVCRFDGAQLGVCVQNKDSSQCESDKPCLVCVPQH